MPVKRVVLFFLLLVCVAPYTAAGAVLNDIIVDNGRTGTSFTGIWKLENSSSVAYGADSLSGSGGTFTWHADIPTAGYYRVYAWWTSSPSRSNSVPFTIMYKTGARTLNVNQKYNGGKWNYVGSFYFDTVRGATVTLTAKASSSATYCADAVKITGGTTSVVIDNTDPGTSSTGTWESRPGNSPGYKGNSMYNAAKGASYSWRAMLPKAGTYKVYAWWVSGPDRSANVPFTMTYKGGAQTVSVDQRANGGRWNYLGTFDIDAAGAASVKLTAGDDLPVISSADAIKFSLFQNVRPAAKIDSIAPSPAYSGDPVSFAGHGEDPDGPITAYSWDSSLDGHLSDSASFSTSSLSRGAHTVTFTVTDGLGATSASVSRLLNVVRKPVEVIVNNGDAGTASTGTWNVSGATGAYGADSLYSNGGATYTWRADLATGKYDVYAWWTTYSTRSKQASYTVTYLGGSQAVTVNQQHLGGQWYYLGTFNFSESGGGKVKLTASDPDPTTYSADAVRFTPSTGTVPAVPLTEDIYASFGYGPYDPEVTDSREYFLYAINKNIGAYYENGAWVYENSSANKIFYIHVSNDMESLKQALQTPDAHVLFGGHSNYGLGAVFSTEAEWEAQTVTDVRYIDDDRILNISSPWIDSNIYMLTYHQAYPNWSPVFKDGTSGVMPFAFGDPKGNPPYNYYITYQIPGDPTFYKMENATHGGFQRFPFSGRPAWYSETGALPDPAVDSQYFITNPGSSIHFSDRTILFRKDIEVPKESMQYARLFWVSCYSGYYYTDTFNRGVMFFTLNDSPLHWGWVMSVYLGEYMNGKSDYEIWQKLQSLDTIFDYYNFNKPPSEQ